MAAQGWHLISVKYPTYEFEQGEPGAYNIRLELLEYWPKHEESRQYINFVEDTGAEYIGSVLRWVYFRKNRRRRFCSVFRYRFPPQTLKTHIIPDVDHIVYYTLQYCLLRRCFLRKPFASNSMITAHLVWFGVFLLLSAVIGRGLLLVISKKNQLCKERTLHE